MFPSHDLPTAEEVAAFLRSEAAAAQTITPHLLAVSTFVRSYTRGNGFNDEGPTSTCSEDIWAVIITATARSYTNPEQRVRQEKDGTSEMPAIFSGFTIAEQYVLNEYRRRTA